MQNHAFFLGGRWSTSGNTRHGRNTEVSRRGLIYWPVVNVPFNAYGLHKNNMVH